MNKLNCMFINNEKDLISIIPQEIKNYWDESFVFGDEYYADEREDSLIIWHTGDNFMRLLAEIPKNLDALPNFPKNIKYYLHGGQYQETPCGESQMIKTIKMKTFW